MPPSTSDLINLLCCDGKFIKFWSARWKHEIQYKEGRTNNIFNLLGCYAPLIGSYRRFGTSYEDGTDMLPKTPICFPKTPVVNN